MIFKTIVHLVGFLFIVVIADARNREPEIMYMQSRYNYCNKKFKYTAICRVTTFRSMTGRTHDGGKNFWKIQIS
jgi:hypothetical protein